MRELFRDEVEQVMAEYELPELPDYYEGPGSAQLVLFRMRENNEALTYCSLEDAQEYCEREDTHGDGWFVGWHLHEAPEDEEDEEEA